MAMLLSSARVGAPEPPLPDSTGWRWPEEQIECVSYVVGRGDTLWTIAYRYYPDDRAGDVIWAIYTANDLGARSSSIEPGDVILIPDPLRYGVGRP